MITPAQSRTLMTAIDMWGWLLWMAAWAPEQTTYPTLRHGVGPDEITAARAQWE